MEFSEIFTGTGENERICKALKQTPLIDIDELTSIPFEYLTSFKRISVKRAETIRKKLETKGLTFGMTAKERKAARLRVLTTRQIDRLIPKCNGCESSLKHCTCTTRLRRPNQPTACAAQ